MGRWSYFFSQTENFLANLENLPKSTAYFSSTKSIEIVSTKKMRFHTAWDNHLKIQLLPDIHNSKRENILSISISETSHMFITTISKQQSSNNNGNSGGVNIMVTNDGFLMLNRINIKWNIKKYTHNNLDTMSRWKFLPIRSFPWNIATNLETHVLCLLYHKALWGFSQDIKIDEISGMCTYEGAKIQKLRQTFPNWYIESPYSWITMIMVLFMAVLLLLFIRAWNWDNLIWLINW